MAAWVVYIAAAALGFSLVRDIQFPGQEDGWLVSKIIRSSSWLRLSCSLQGQDEYHMSCFAIGFEGLVAVG